MAKTYSEFKDFLQATMWRTGDSVLAADLDSLIQMADSKLNRELRVPEMVTITTDNVEAETLAVPTGFIAMKTIMATALATPLTAITNREMQIARLDTNAAMRPFYSLAGSTLLFAGPMSVSDPEPVEMIYYAKVPDYSGTDASWLETEYLDVYTYACLSEAGMYLREDARIPIWTQLYQAALDRANRDERAMTHTGSPLQPSLPSGIA